MADINKLKDKIKSTIYPNGKGAINASDHQAMLLNIADGIAELSEEIGNVNLMFGINDFPNKNKGFYKYDTGIQIVSDDRYMASDFIAVKSGETLIYQGATSTSKTMMCVVFCDQNKNYLSNVSIAFGDLVTGKANKIVVPSNAYFVRFAASQAGDFVGVYKASRFETSFEEIMDATDKAIVEIEKEVAIVADAIPYTNMIDKSNLLIGYYINGADGSLQGEGTNAYFNATPYLLIKANTTYYCGNVFAQSDFMAFYSLQKEFLSKTDAQFIIESGGTYNMKIVGGQNDVFVRLSIVTEKTPQAFVSQFYKEEKPREIDYSLCAPTAWEEIRSINNKINDLDYSINILDKSGLTPKSYIDENGNVGISESTTFSATGFLLLEPNSVYHIYGIYKQGLYAFYDLDKKVKSEAALGVRIENDMEDINNNYHFHISTSSAYAYFRGSVEDGFLDSCYVSKVVDAYYPCGQVSYEEGVFLAVNSVKLKDKKVLIVGDSISTDYYGNYPKWVTALKNIAFLPYNTTNSSVHATGYVATSGGSYESFITRVHKVEQKDSYDLVLIFGGVNDFIQDIPMGASGDDKGSYFMPAVEYLFEYFIENFTNARIGVILPLKSSNQGANAEGLYLTDYVDCIKNVAKTYCYPVLNLTEESGFCPYIRTFKDRWTLTDYVGGDGKTGDGLHPNEEYERMFLAPMIQSFISSII